MAVNKKITECTENTVALAANDMIAVVDVSDTTDAASGTTKKQSWLNTIKFLLAAVFAEDSGSTDTYVATLSPAPTAYVVGQHYRFKANTANTGPCTVNFNSLGAKTIKKAAGGITTDLADNDIRAGQWADLVYDGTNMQMQSLLGNAPAGGGGTNPTSGVIPYNNAGSFADSQLVREDANTIAQRNAANAQTLNIYETYTSPTVHAGLRIGRGLSGDVVVGTFQGSGGGSANGLKLHGNTKIEFGLGTGVSSPTIKWELIAGAFYPSTDNQESVCAEGKRGTNVWLSQGVKFSDNATNSESPFMKRVSGSVEQWDQNEANFTFFKDAGRLRTTANFDKTDTTLANITGLTSQNLKTATPYRFRAVLFVDANATGGFKFAISGTATATSIIYQIQFLDNAADTFTVNSRHIALDSSDGNAGPTAGICVIEGMILVNAAGTISVQFAQNAASGTSSILANSMFRVEKF